MNTPQKTKLYKHSVYKRFYFRQNYDICCTIESHLQYMLENKIEEIDIFLAKRETDSGYFFCKHFNKVGEKSYGGCGKMCQTYQPRNGKSGACKLIGYVYEKTDKCFSLKVDNVDMPTDSECLEEEFSK